MHGALRAACPPGGVVLELPVQIAAVETLDSAFAVKNDELGGKAIQLGSYLLVPIRLFPARERKRGDVDWVGQLAELISYTLQLRPLYVQGQEYPHQNALIAGHQRDLTQSISNRNH